MTPAKGLLIPPRSPVAGFRPSSPHGGSTLTTSAPCSASACVPYVPAITCPSSSTRMPSSGRIGRGLRGSATDQEALDALEHHLVALVERLDVAGDDPAIGLGGRAG